jgi:hypothetical protein
MEANQIPMETNSDMLYIHFSIFFPSSCILTSRGAASASYLRPMHTVETYKHTNDMHDQKGKETSSRGSYLVTYARARTYGVCLNRVFLVHLTLGVFGQLKTPE